MNNNTRTFETFRKKILNTCYIMETIVFITEFIFYFTYNGAERAIIESLENGKLLYLLRFLIIPTILSFGEIIIFTIINKSNKFSTNTKNVCVLFCVLLFTGIIQLSHCVYPALICAVCVPIFISTIFGDKKITTLIHYCSYPLIILSFFESFFDIRINEQLTVVNDYIVGLLVVICVYISSIALIKIQKLKNKDIIDGYLKQQELQELLKLDSLTHLYNHSAIHDILSELTKRNPLPKIVLAMIDIDNFKNVNDNYGHPNGDNVIEVLAVLIKNNICNGAYAARYGGEEFAIVFTNTDMKDVLKTTNKILFEFSHYNWHFMDNSHITFSCGLAELTENGLTTKDYFDLPDKALYKAKANGKNQIVISK